MIQQYGLFIQLVLLTVYLGFFRVFNSFVCVMSASIVVCCVHYVYEKFLLDLSRYEEYRDLVVILWYNGFAITDVLLVVFVVRTCNLKGVEMDVVTKMICLSFLALAFIQIARYFDRIIIGTDKLGFLVHTGIPTINTSITILAFTVVSVSLINCIIKRGLLLWR